MEIPFNRLYLTGREKEYVSDAINRGGISGDKHYTKKVSRFLEEKFTAKKALMTTSCTHALEMACRLTGLKPGDEVIMPSFTFPSTANAALLCGANPVFADIDPKTLNIDPEKIKEKITKKTRAIIPVHYAGVACDMDRISQIACENDLKVIEDAAQGVNAKYKKRYLGTIGDFGCYSFHETKNYVCGEGGALIINTDDEKTVQKAEIMREKGTNRSRFLRGEIDKYTWVDIGSSYLPSDIVAAFLYGQLEEIDEIQSKRMRIWKSYHELLKPYEEKGIIKLPNIPDYAKHNAHIYYILFQTGKERDNALTRLKDCGISATHHYQPLHTSPMGEKIGYKKGMLPVTENMSARLLRLPIYPSLSDEELEHIRQILSKYLIL